ncbi:CDP-alcohol phosphatidyltransferase family protein [Natronolimnobius sp. AArcel1]|uniref:CDP-alcohol phosphatidyltransferase family protein n=1 Tax=Natronolimnobius sp. AArcel1 TaxID=1679093 RepID=UPI0013ECE613|nr:CDP-alcohol phosphatidyltransferase family protein [Natronolimnobius sp. AArcel1]NGM70954.1 CDP-alcohol phosphatidyltransferase family protein [Natronolimnobius sp. AArcel1]
MSDSLLEDSSGQQVRSLWGRATLGLWLGAWGLVIALERATAGDIVSAHFLAVVGCTIGLVSGIFFRIVSKTTRTAGLEPVTLATWVTVTRGAAIVVLAGFIVVPSPDGLLAWLPALLFAVGAALDAVDGLLARRTGTTTMLGAQFDVETDALVVLVGTLVAIATEAVPLAFLAVGIARYLFVFGSWWRRRHGRPVYDLPESRLRRPLGALAMVTIWLALLPPVAPGLSRLIALVVMVPFVLNFARDWVAVAGWHR